MSNLRLRNGNFPFQNRKGCELGLYNSTITVYTGVYVNDGPSSDWWYHHHIIISRRGITRQIRLCHRLQPEREQFQHLSTLVRWSLYLLPHVWWPSQLLGKLHLGWSLQGLDHYQYQWVSLSAHPYETQGQPRSVRSTVSFCCSLWVLHSEVATWL